ncbi:MAG: DUF484 family protein [Pseudomonadota bacterium]
MEPQHIALFLKQNPRFFDNHPDILESIQLAGSNPNSLVERQAVLLQQKKNELEKQLLQFLQNGEANDRISAQLHRLTLDLIYPTHLEDLLSAIPILIQEHFAAAQVILYVWGNSELSVPASFPRSMTLDTPPSSWKNLFSLKTPNSLDPICTHELPSDIKKWFQAEMSSFALLPLEHSAGAWGFLGLGSYDVRRFQPSHGTVYLKRLAEIVSAVLAKHM